MKKLDRYQLWEHARLLNRANSLLRIAMVWNIPVACNRASADFMFSSPLMSDTYERLIPDYSSYRSRLEAAAAS